MKNRTRRGSEISQGRDVPESSWGVALIGPGRVGQAMAQLLARAGVRIRFVAARRLSRARQAARFIGSGKVVRLDDPALAGAKIFLITVKDSAIAPVAGELAGIIPNWRGRIALHTCGSASASLLTPLARKGASIGSVHPYQTVPSREAGIKNLPGGYWAVDGDARARRLAGRWVKLLKGTSFSIPANRRTLYHLSAFLVSPTTVTLIDQSEKLLRIAGVPKRVIRPMLTRFVGETLENFAQFGALKSLTGPAIRGDWTTLEKHAAALKRTAPQLLPLYHELVVAMLRVAGKRSRALDSGRAGRGVDRKANFIGKFKP